MGLIATILQFVRATRYGAKTSDVKVDPGGGPVLTAEYFSTIGDDSQPLPGDYTVAVRVLSTGRYKSIGYIDPKNQSTAGPGEKRIYSRSASGSQTAQAWLKSDGTIRAENDAASVVISPDGTVEIDNGSGNFTMASGGNVTINGVVIDTGGNITAPAIITGATVAAVTSLTVDGQEMGLHYHFVSSTPSNSGPPI